MQSTVYGTSEIDKPDETDRAFAAIAVTVEKPTLEPSQWKELFEPSLRATAALTRLDERLRTSPVREGYLARMAFHEAVASMWLGGELVHLEDLVLHDAHMDIRAPTHELTMAHQVLRATRQVAANKSNWVLSAAGLQSLRGLKPLSNSSEIAGGTLPLTLQSFGSRVQSAFPDTDGDTADEEFDVDVESAATLELDRQLAEMDAKLKRLDDVLQSRSGQRRAVAGNPAGEFAGGSMGGEVRYATPLNRLIYDEDDDVEAQLADWQSRLKATEELPLLLRAALALDDWNQHEILPRAPWLGPLLAASMLRGADEGKNQRGSVSFELVHLPVLKMGLRAIPRERRNAKDQTIRLVALIEAFEQSALIGLKEHDRLILAREQMLRKLKGKRGNSKLPQLIDLVLSRPLVTSTIIERELKVTLQGALNLVAELGLREVTGRGRYRAWAVA